MRQKLCNYAIIIIFLGCVSAANYPLEILNIDEAGLDNRIRFAYPGIEYKVVIAAFGGTYPYEWELLQAPQGMVIDSDDGEIRWSSPGTIDSGSVVEVSVTDSEGNTDTENFTITVTNSTGRFIFSDSINGDQSGTGSIGDPYSSLDDFWNENHAGKIVYFREGNYTYPKTGPYSDRNGCLRVDIQGTNPASYLGYPGEDVYLDGEYEAGSSYAFAVGGMNDAYFQNIILQNNYQYGLVWWGGDYGVVYDCEFKDMYTDNGTHNQAYINSMASGGSNKIVISHNEFLPTAEENNGTNLCAVETYDFYNGSWQYNNVSIDQTYGFFFKANNQYIVVKGNIFEGNTYGGGTYIYGGGQKNLEICYNLFRDDELDLYSTSTEAEEDCMENIHVYRNTFIGVPNIRSLYDTSITSFKDGFLNWSNNVIQNDLSDSGSIPGDFQRDHVNYRRINQEEYDRITSGMSGDLRGTDIVDPITGKLTSGYSEYLGTHGWEIMTYEILVEDLHENASVEDYQTRNIVTEGCAPWGTGECIMMNCSDGDCSGTNGWTLQIPDGEGKEITIEWGERYNVWPLEWSLGGCKSIRPYHGSGSGHYMAAFITYHGGNSMYMSSWENATLNITDEITDVVVNDDPWDEGWCEPQNPDGTFDCNGRLKYSWEGMGTDWRKMRMWIKMPQDFTTGDGEIKLWVDGQLHFHLHEIYMDPEGVPETTRVLFAPVDETATPHEHWYDEITIYKGYVPPSQQAAVCGDGICDGDEDYLTCPEDCFHPADNDHDGTVSDTEIRSYVNSWVEGMITMQELVSGIEEWKT